MKNSELEAGENYTEKYCMVSRADFTQKSTEQNICLIESHFYIRYKHIKHELWKNHSIRIMRDFLRTSSNIFAHLHTTIIKYFNDKAIFWNYWISFCDHENQYRLCTAGNLVSTEQGTCGGHHVRSTPSPDVLWLEQSRGLFLKKNWRTDFCDSFWEIYFCISFQK